MTTPVDPDQWPARCTCAYLHATLCPLHGKWPNRHTPDALDVAAELNTEHDRIDPRIVELAETCRVLTELAQQLVDAAYQANSKSFNDILQGALGLQDALDAAAELGITPTTDQP